MGKQKNPYMKTPFPDFDNPENMNKKHASAELEDLREAIEHHNHLYYVENDPDISDKAYDRLFDRLQKLETEFPSLDSDTSPTKKVGAPPLDSLKKKDHVKPMLSLKSSPEEEEVKSFFEDVQKKSKEDKPVFILEPKFDGFSLEIVYENGEFSYAATRGDGITGEDVSKNAKTIGSLPLRLKNKDEMPATLAVRGEVFLPLDGFEKLNKERIENGKDAFANARNAAAGLVRQLDSKKVADKPLDIFVYEIMNSGDVESDYHHDVRKKLETWGFHINDKSKKCKTFSEIKTYYNTIADQRENLPYEIDGVVIKLDDLSMREKLGTRERNPRWAFAWKFRAKKEVTKLRDIVVQVGRTGILTPVALLDPVEIGGVTVSRASLHNEKELKKKDVRPGDKVRVERAGDVIPEVTERVEKSKKRGKEFSMPKHCPVCNTEVVQEGAYTICPAGWSCRAQLKGRIEHFASKKAMNIESLGEKVAAQLVDNGFVKTLPDLYRLDKDRLKELEGFADKSAGRLKDEIEKSKKVSLTRYLYALGIRHVGEHVARLLADEFEDFDAVRNAGYDELVNLSEIGPEIAESIKHFFSTEDNQKLLTDMEDLGLDIQSGGRRQSHVLDGLTIVLTGELDNYTRDEAKEKIEKLGGNATSSVSGNTDYLVKGKDPGSKLEDAKEHDVQVIDEKAFTSLLKNGGIE